MLEYRVTKYDPKHRNEQGLYLLEDWTEFADVGKSVTKSEYEAVEHAYIDSATEFAGLWSDSWCTITGLENSGRMTDLREGERIAVADMRAVLKSVLRAEFWCRLEAIDGFIHIGWDFYMYIGVPKVDKGIIRQASEKGLFVERFSSPHRR